MGVTKNVTLLRPGPSLIGRLYESNGNIARAVARAQAEIADPSAPPLTVMTNHAAGQADDVLSTVGQIISVGQNELGEAVGVIEFADTPAGKACASLATSKATSGKPFVKGMSIRGAWMTPPHRVQHGGRLLETADDLRIAGLDFTHRPSGGGAVGEAAEDGSFSEPVGGFADLVRKLVTEALAGVVMEPAAAGTMIDLDADYGAMSPDEKSAFRGALYRAAILGAVPG